MIKFCQWRHGLELWSRNLYFKNTFVLRRLRVAIFDNIIKIVTIFIKTIFKVKSIRTYISKCSLCLYFLIQQSLLISSKKCWYQQNSSVVSRDSYIFLDLLWVRYNCAKFYHFRICVTDSRERLSSPPIREQPPKEPSWIGLRLSLSL